MKYSLSTDLIDELIAKGSISRDDVLRLRREVWKDSRVDAKEVEAIFHLDHACAEKDPAWTQFYVDALTEYFVWRTEPQKYVSEESTKYLLDQIMRDGHVDSSSELELLINIVYWSVSCPEELAVFALEAVKESVLTPQTAAYGSNRPPAIIGPSDVEIIRRVIYAEGSPGGYTVTQREAELIFELNNATVDAENAPSWQDLFVKATANYLMFPRGAPVVPSAEEALRRELWLNERRGVGNLLWDVGRETVGSFSSGKFHVAEAYDALDPGGRIGSRQEREKEERLLKEAMRREAIDPHEAKWLIDHIKADGIVHESERALLTFIKQNSPHIDPSLVALMDELGI